MIAFVRSVFSLSCAVFLLTPAAFGGPDEGTQEAALDGSKKGPPVSAAQGESEAEIPASTEGTDGGVATKDTSDDSGAEAGKTAQPSQHILYDAIDYATVRVIASAGIRMETETWRGTKAEVAYPAMGHGSGVVVSGDGLIITAAHVVDEATLITVLFPGSEEAVPAKVVEMDVEADFAILKTATQPTHVALLAPEDAQLVARQKIFVIGYPFDVTRNDPQSSVGVVSGFLPSGDLQLDGTSNPGNSGGPVVNQEEEVLGILVRGGSGLSYAVPLHRIRPALEQASASLSGISLSQLERPGALTEAHGLAESAMRFEGDFRPYEKSRDYKKYERLFLDLVRHNPKSAVAHLFGAAFFYNRALYLKGINPERASIPQANAKKLLQRAKRLAPATVAQSSDFARAIEELGEKLIARPVGAKKDQELHHIQFRAANHPEAEAMRLLLHQADAPHGSALFQGRWDGRTPYYKEICAAPCSFEVPDGIYYLGVARGMDPVRAVDPVDVSSGATLEAEYKDRKNLRRAGYVVAGLGAVAAIVGGVVFFTEKDPTDVTHLWVGTAGMILGAGGLTAGLAMVATPDGARIRVVPGLP